MITKLVVQHLENNLLQSPDAFKQAIRNILLSSKT